MSSGDPSAAGNALTDGILAAIAWESGRPAIAALRGLFHAYLQRLFEDWLADLAPAAVRTEVFGLHLALRDCGWEAHLRWLTAPQTVSTLFGSPRTRRAEQLDFARKTLACELDVRRRSRYVGGETLATALGDAVLRPGCDQADSSHRFVTRATVVDFSSPWCSQALPDAPEALWLYPAHAWATLGTRICAALIAVGEAAPVAGDLIASFVRTVVVHETRDDSRAFLSGSWRRLIGKVGFVNPALATHEQLVDAFIHESIHSALYALELFEPLCDYESLSPATRIVSPWTGAVLPVHSYVHACFVWSGLRCFWAARGRRDCMNHLEVDRLAARAAVGFTRGPLAGPVRSLVPEATAARISATQLAALATLP